jgi:hypothetical protein
MEGRDGARLPVAVAFKFRGGPGRPGPGPGRFKLVTPITVLVTRPGPGGAALRRSDRRPGPRPQAPSHWA